MGSDDQSDEDKLTPSLLLPSLRQEIVESQKARIDFLKYKSLIIGGIIGVGSLGMSEKIEFHPMILALTPLCCLYKKKI